MKLTAAIALLILTLLLYFNQFAQAQTSTPSPEIELDPVVVIAQSGMVASGQDSVASAEERVRLTPGAASVVTPDQWTGRTVTTEQIFQFVPGVSARNRGVGSDVRLSVRGSGIQRQFGDRGITLMLDGVPINDADGSFYFRSIDPLSVNHIEVFPGANGLAYGGSQLGGVINVVQKNGLNSPGVGLLTEYGSFDSYRGAIQYGGSGERWDWFIGYTYSESDGYRENTAARTHFANASLGYHWSDTATTRLYLHYSDSDASLTGSLSPREFSQNPRQRGSNRTDEADRDLATFRVGQRTEWETGNGEWSFYTSYQNLDFDHLINEGLFRFNRFIDYDTDEGQIGIRGEEKHQLFGIENTARFLVAANYGRQEEDGFSGFVRPGRPAATVDRENTASNVQLYFENDAEFIQGHHLVLGGGGVNAERRSRFEDGDETGEAEFDLSDSGATYRAGYLYEVSDDTQFFANFSQSFEGSPFSESESALDPQFARTLEAGTRFGNTWASGELALYQSWVNDEFVDTETAPGVSETTNLDTVHRGVEASLFIDITELVGLSSGPRLFFDQSYQFNDFEIDEGPDQGNALPGVSEHVYSGRVRLEGGGSRWSLALSTDWLPEGFVADNANTLRTGGFSVWRLNAEVRVRDGVQVFAGIDNLFDESYVNNVTVNPSGDGFLDPGDGRSFYVGLRLDW